MHARVVLYVLGERNVVLFRKVPSVQCVLMDGFVFSLVHASL